MISGIQKINVFDKSFLVQDFGEIVNDSIGVKSNKDELTSHYNYEDTGERLIGNCPTKIYYVNGEYYGYFDDGFLRKKNGKKFNKISPVNFSTSPQIFSLLKDGRKVLAVKRGKGALTIGDKTDFIDLEGGSSYLYYKGMLFIADKNKLKFGGDYDYSFLEKDSKLSRFIVIDEKYGEIKSLVTYGEKLIIVCKKGLLSLIIKGESSDFIMTEVCGDTLNVKDGSVKKVGDRIYFLSDNSLYFYNGKINKAKSIIDGVKISFSGEATGKDNLYCLPITCQGNKKLFVFSESENADYFLDITNLILAEEGLAINKNTGAIMALKKDATATYVWQSKFIDFNKPRKKFLKSLNMYSKFPLSVKISGDFGERVFNFNEGDICFTCNLRSNSFSVTLIGETGLNVKNLQFIYNE